MKYNIHKASDKVNKLPGKEYVIGLENSPGNQRIILSILFVLGFCAIPAQAVIFRELMLACSGNELIIGIIFANWLLVTAIGVYAGRFIKIADHNIPFLSVFIAWIPVVLLFIIDFLRNKLFMPGVQINLLQIFSASFILFLPFCFFSGLLFTRLTMVLRKTLKNNAGERAYAAESVGSFAGGILFSFVLSYFYDNYRAACTIALVSNAIVILYYHRKISAVVIASFIFLFLLPITYEVFVHGSQFARQLLFSNQKILTSKDTPYGNLTVTNTVGQLNFFENNVLLFATDNQLSSEEAVHFAMIQHPSPKKILLISGGIAGLTREILKYSDVKEIDYLEIDPAIVNLGRKYTTSLNDKRIEFILGDARLFIQHTRHVYDVVIISIPEPSSIQLNRFYTSEFLSNIKKNLADSGVLTFSLPPAVNYMNEGAVRMNSSLYNTCKRLFREVKIIPGERNYFVASDARINLNICQQIENKRIETIYVNSYYMDDRLLTLRAISISEQLTVDEKQNTDFKPIAFYGFLQYWLNQFAYKSYPEKLIIAMAIVFIILVFILSPVMSGMFAAGFSSSALQIIILISFQIVYGYVYRSLGAFSAVFMAGLCLGSLLRPRIMRICTPKKFALLQGILAIISLIIPSLIIVSDKIASWPLLVHLVFFLIILCVSLITGLIFSSAVQVQGAGKSGTVPVIYGIDLVGAALGAILVILLIIPIAGILNAPYMIGFMNLMVTVNIIIREHSGI